MSARPIREAFFPTEEQKNLIKQWHFQGTLLQAPS